MTSIQKPARSRKNGRRWRRRLLAVLLGLSPFFFFELVLQVFSIGPSYQESRGKKDMTRIDPLFVKEKNEGGGVWFASPAWFGGMRYYDAPGVPRPIKRPFQVPKPSDVYRIFTMGGSSAAGFPFGASAAFSTWLEILLNESDPSRNYEVINLGINGLSSYEIKDLIPEVIAAQPDLIIIYMGHNDCNKVYQGRLRMGEFPLHLHYGLLHLRTYRLLFESVYKKNWDRDNERFLYFANLRKKGERPEHADLIFSERARELVRENFVKNLDQIIKECREAGVILVLCTAQSNLRDYAPEGSVHGRKLSEAERDDWEQGYQEGRRALALKDDARALAAFEKAKAIDDEYSLLRYYTGKALVGLGRYEEAKLEFKTTLDDEDLPARAMSFINPIIREKAKREGVILVDVEAAFTRATPDGIPGKEWFLDGLHPRFEGHRLIATTIFNHLIEAGMINPDQHRIQEAVKVLDLYQQSFPDWFRYENYFFLATAQEYQGRLCWALDLSQRALKFKPESGHVQSDGIDVQKDMVDRLTPLCRGIDTSE